MKRPLVAFALLAVANAAFAQSFADVQAELSYQENFTRSERAIDAREDMALSTMVTAGTRLQPGDYTSLTIAGTLSRTQYRQYTGLSSWEAGLGLTGAHKFGIGERQPTLSIELGLARNEYNMPVRDAWIYRAALGLQKRLTDTLDVRGGIRYEVRDADHDIPRVIPSFPRPGNSWDVDSRTAFITAEQDLGPATWLAATYQFQQGDVVSTAIPYPKIFNTATAITLDPLFGPLAVAYRIPARTHILALEINRAIFASSTLYLGYEYQKTHGRNGVDYDSSVLRSGFIFGF
jgi:hypothetical protein